jgi:hypothetical protein
MSRHTSDEAVVLVLVSYLQLEVGRYQLDSSHPRTLLPTALVYHSTQFLMTRKPRRSRSQRADLEAQPEDEGARYKLSSTLCSPFSTKGLDSWRLMK